MSNKANGEDPRFLIVTEGSSDLSTIGQLLGAHSIRFNPTPKKAGSENVVKKLVRRSIGGGNLVEKAAIIIDADTDPTKRFQSYRKFFIELGYIVPDEMPREGLVLRENSDPNMPELAFWMMPDNIHTGCLENLLQASLYQEDPRWIAIEQAAQTHNFLQYPNPNHRAKSQIWTWLAWQAEPQNLSGLGFHRGAFNPNSPNATAFVQWLSRFFGLA